jgi:hypothetical protein
MRNRILRLAVVIGFFFTLIVVSNAKADVYVKVDASGNAISGAIACGADVCGDANSVYSQLTLGAGERYVLQGTGSTGIGNNNQDRQVKVDLQTNEWTVTTQPEPTVVAQQTVQATTVEKFNPVLNTPTTINTEVKVLETKPINNKSQTISETSTATVDEQTLMETELLDINSPNWWKVFITWLNRYFDFNWWFQP